MFGLYSVISISNSLYYTACSIYSTKSGITSHIEKYKNPSTIAEMNANAT